MASLGDLNPKYWYEDVSGKVKKYVYCSLCHAGPFKEFEEQKSFVLRGNKGGFCIPCARAHKFFNDPLLDQKLVDIESIPQPFLQSYKILNITS